MELIYFKSRLHSYLIAIKRKLSLLFKGEFNPYPAIPEGVFLNPSDSHSLAYQSVPLSLSWTNSNISDLFEWQKTARAKLEELTGYERRKNKPVVIDKGVQRLSKGLTRQSYFLRINEASDIPVTLVWDSDLKRNSPLPIMICLHGHDSGSHLSWGEKLMPDDPRKIANGADYGLQAATYGFLAVCIEQSCFGLRREFNIKNKTNNSCIDAVNHALLLGRTLLGERVSDVSSVIDWLEITNLPVSIEHKFYIMGNSSGGETSVYTMALDARINGVIASGCVGGYRETIGRRAGCSDTIIPGILNYFEYKDIIRLCAPRLFLGVSGVDDHLYPFSIVKNVIEEARDSYISAGLSNNLQCISGPAGHRFYPELAWPKFIDMISASIS